VILLVDNYDSFTWNLYQVMGSIEPAVEVLRNDAVTADEVAAGLRGGRWRGIVLSPGPGTPDESGVCLEILRRFSGSVPILGVCLGHQALCQVQGGRVVRAALPVHGKASEVEHDGSGVLRGLPSPFLAGRYHSLVAERASLPPSLRVTAWTATGEVMGVEHVSQPSFGVQFHPESILTPDGERILSNFLEIVRLHGGWRDVA
jgi:anthranilate synthase/aminodeoxychorismate synthase-like glutamine amidotransferase